MTKSLTLKDLENKYDRVTIATPEDNPAILAFFATITMDTSALQLRYERSPDYFCFLTEQGQPSVVFLYINDDASIGGISAITSRNCVVNGKPVRICYAGDLRVSPTISRRARVQWRSLYRDVIANYRTFADLGCPEYMFSVILDGNRDAIQAFLKPDGNPRYRKLIDYDSVNILGQLNPVGSLLTRGRCRKAGYVLSWASEKDFPLIKDFLIRENSYKALGIDYTAGGADELERRLRLWKEFEKSSFLLLRQNDSLIGCMAPWSNGESRRIVVEKAPLALKLLGAVLPLLGKAAVRVNHELKVLYLTCVEIDSSRNLVERQEIFAFMIDFLLRSGRCRHHNIVSLLDAANCPLAGALEGRGYLWNRQKAGLYQVLSPQEDQDGHFLSVREGELPGFELATA